MLNWTMPAMTLEISEDDILKSFERDNPWWTRNSIEDLTSGYHERSYLKPFKDIAFNWEINRSIILMGPRRVGKTVMLNQLVAYALSRKFPPQNIFFISVDTPLYSGIHLERLIKLYEKQCPHNAEERRIVIFDEIQYLKDWETHLKVLTDKHPNTKFIASGSAAAALRLKSQESGAGRFTDFFLPPLTFSEFLNFRDVDQELIVEGNEDGKKIYTTNNISALNKEFLNYLNFGGYPEAVLNPEIQKDVTRYLGRDIIDKVLLRDLPSLYGIQDIQELNRLFSTIAYHSGREINLESLASSSGVQKQTINRYLEYLEAAFLIVRVWRVDESGHTFKRNRQFKVYLTNPSMRAALFTPIDDDDEAMGNLAETAIFSQWFHAASMRNIHYARWKSGRQQLEVDLVHLTPSNNYRPSWAYEVKWSDRYVDRPSELKGLIEFAKKNFPKDLPVGVSTKTITDTAEHDGVTIKFFPCALHCYRVGRNLTEPFTS